MKKIFLICFLLFTFFIFSSQEGRGQLQVANATAKPSVLADFGNVTIHTTSDYRTFTLYGSNLTSDLKVGPAINYSFSLAPDGNYSSSVTVSPVNGVADQNIYVRFSPDSVKTYSTLIPISGGGVTAFNIQASGSGASSFAKMSIHLLADNGNTINSVDAALAVFDDKFSAAIADEDSYKFENRDENLALNRNGTLLSIEGRPSLTSTDTIPLTLRKLKSKDYYLQLTGAGFPPLASIVVIDKFLNTVIPVSLSSTTRIPFTNDSASYMPDRFSIILTMGGVLAATITNLKAAVVDKGVALSWKSEAENHVDKYEIERSFDGRMFYTASSLATSDLDNSTRSYSWLDENAASGSNYYRLKIIDKTGEITYSEIVKANFKKRDGQVRVFPNPAQARVVNFKMEGFEKGNYRIIIYDNSGKKVYSSAINHNGSLSNYSINVNSCMTKGIYFLNISANSRSINRSIILN